MTRRRLAARGLLVAAALVALAAMAAPAAAEADTDPAPADVAVEQVDRMEDADGQVYEVEYEAGLAMRLDAVLFGSDDLERALLAQVDVSGDARFRSLTLDSAVVVES